MNNQQLSRHQSLVSVILVAHSNMEWLRRSIPTLLSQSYTSIEVIVVDNASTDGGGRYVERFFPKVRVVYSGENRGFGAGCQAGVNVSRGKYLIFGNEDMEFDRDYVERLVAVLEGDHTIGACQGTTFSFNDPRKNAAHLRGRQFSISNFRNDNTQKQREKLEIQSRGLYFNYTGMLTGDAKKLKSDENVREIFAATAPLCVRRTIYDMVGGFDRDFFLYFEEVDLSWRIWLRGKRVVHVPEAHAFHLGGGSTRKLPPEEILEYTIRNRLQSYLLNLGSARLAVALASQLLMGSAALVIFVVQRKWTLLLAVVKADIWVFINLWRILAKRSRIQRERKMGDQELIARVGGRFPITKLMKLGGIGG